MLAQLDYLCPKAWAGHWDYPPMGELHARIRHLIGQRMQGVLAKAVYKGTGEPVKSLSDGSPDKQIVGHSSQSLTQPTLP